MEEDTEDVVEHLEKMILELINITGKIPSKDMYLLGELCGKFWGNPKNRNLINLLKKEKAASMRF